MGAYGIYSIFRCPCTFVCYGFGSNCSKCITDKNECIGRTSTTPEHAVKEWTTLLLVQDQDYKVVEISEAFARDMFGASADEMIGEKSATKL